MQMGRNGGGELKLSSLLIWEKERYSIAENVEGRRSSFFSTEERKEGYNRPEPSP